MIETLSVMLRIEFENTKQKEDAECIGAALRVACYPGGKMAERYGNAGWCLHVVNDAQDSGRGA
mgnify:FL=1